MMDWNGGWEEHVKALQKAKERAERLRMKEIDPGSVQESRMEIPLSGRRESRDRQA